MEEYVKVLKKYLPTVFDYAKVRPIVWDDIDDSSEDNPKKPYMLPMLKIPRKQEGYFDISAVSLKKKIEKLGFAVVLQTCIYEDMEKGSFVITKGDISFQSSYFLGP